MAMCDGHSMTRRKDLFKSGRLGMSTDQKQPEIVDALPGERNSSPMRTT